MLRVFDAHVHFFDRDQNVHQFLEHEDSGLQEHRGRLLGAARSTRPGA